jgi:hypothetical protein
MRHSISNLASGPKITSQTYNSTKWVPLDYFSVCEYKTNAKRKNIYALIETLKKNHPFIVARP